MVIRQDDIPEIPFYRLRYYVEELRRAGFQEDGDRLEQIIRENEEIDHVERVRQLIMKDRVRLRLRELPQFFPIDSARNENIILHFYFYNELTTEVIRRVARDDKLLILYPNVPHDIIANAVIVNVNQLQPLIESEEPITAMRKVFRMIEQEALDSFTILASSDTENYVTHVNAMRVFLIYRHRADGMPALVSSEVAYLGIDEALQGYRSSQQMFVIFRHLFGEIIRKIGSKYYDLPRDFDPFEDDIKFFDVKNYEDFLEEFNVLYVSVAFLIRAPIGIDWRTFRELYKPFGNTLVFHTIRFIKRLRNESVRTYRELMGYI